MIISISLFYQCKPVSKKQIDKISVTAIHWDTSVRYRLDAEQIFNWKGEKTTGVICDQSILDEISGQIKHLKPLEGFDDVNARMVCIIFHQNGTIDTLKVGSPRIISINGIVYDKNPDLTRLIEENISSTGCN